MVELMVDSGVIMLMMKSMRTVIPIIVYMMEKQSNGCEVEDEDNDSIGNFQPNLRTEPHARTHA
jgi:hypothetical protein